MPSDASVNLKTSAAAALCARFLIHPLEHFRHQTANKPPQQCQQHAAHYRPRQHYTPRELILTLQKTYRGVSFALINVPALAFFLSTYDAAKHGQAHVATALQLPRFHLHHFENHLISGMMAKVAGTILWAPMAKLNSLQSHHPSQEPLSFKNAFRLARQVCQSSPRGGGVLSLWSDYGTTLRALLPYTMLYFAVYEQLKQLARRYLYETQDPAGEFRNRNCALQRGHRPPTEATPSPLGLGTYMSCVAGAVAISSTVCHIASALTKHFKELFHSHSTPSTPSSSAIHLNSSPDPATVHTKSASPVLRAPSAPASYPTLFARQQTQHTSITTHTSTTTTTTMTASMATTTANILTKESAVRTTATPQTSTPMSRRPLISNGCNKASRRAFPMRLPRTILRGLGPRILWTAPNVVLTTAGFEVLRNMALATA